MSAVQLQRRALDLNGFDLISRHGSAGALALGELIGLLGLDSVAIGTNAAGGGFASTAVGRSANGGANLVAAFGSNTAALFGGTAIGATAFADAFSVALGSGASAPFPSSVAIGAGAASTGPNQASIGSFSFPIDDIEVFGTLGLNPFRAKGTPAAGETGIYIAVNDTGVVVRQVLLGAVLGAVEAGIPIGSRALYITP